jgi:hypothetical protein
MKNFLLRFFYFSILPLALFGTLVTFYIKRDVYQDIGTYENYSWKYFVQPLGDISTKKLLHSTTPYNSFIFGSSRTCGVYACYLQHHIPGSRFFHYANWSESIGGIYAKINLLDSLGYRIDNVLFYFDTDATFSKEGKCVNDHYLLTGEGKAAYYLEHFRNYVPPNLDREKFDLLFLNSPEKKAFPNWHSDKQTNDANHTCSDSTVLNYGYPSLKSSQVAKVDSLKKIGFSYTGTDPQVYSPPQISADEQKILRKIKALLVKHHTAYSIVITPLCDRLKFNAADLSLLKNILGEHVFDFSGTNGVTANAENYPDKKHFPPYVSKLIVDSVFIPLTRH